MFLPILGEEKWKVHFKAVPSRAAEILGGVEELASRLGLAAGTVRMMIAEKLPVPQQVFLQVVDIISDDDAPHRGS